MELMTLNAGQPLTMSSREIAELCDKEHKNVIRDIRVMLDELGDGSDLSHVQESKDLRGYTSSISLPKDLTLTLVAGYNVKLRKRIIDRWMELEESASKPRELSRLELLQIAMDSEQKRIQAEQKNALLEYKVAEQAPKVQFHDDVANTINCQTVDEVAKELGTGRNRLYAFLRKKGVLKYNNEPYQRFIDQGYFRVIPSPWRKRGELQMGQKTVVTGKGMTYIHRLINNLTVELPANDHHTEVSA